jgi:hypothetical protein
VCIQEWNPTPGLKNKIKHHSEEWWKGETTDIRVRVGLFGERSKQYNETMVNSVITPRAVVVAGDKTVTEGLFEKSGNLFEILGFYRATPRFYAAKGFPRFGVERETRVVSGSFENFTDFRRIIELTHF